MNVRTHCSHYLNCLLLIVAVMSNSGCTNLFTPLGDNQYDCNRKENPDSPYCHSFKSVEAATTGPVPDSRYDQVMKLAEQDKLTGIAPVRVATANEPGDPASHHDKGNDSGNGTSHQEVRLPHQAENTASTAALDGLPVRTGPVVQRIWIKRFVDGSDLLTSDTTVYKEIIPTHWAGFPAPQDAQSPSVGGTLVPHKPQAAPLPQKIPAAASAESAVTQLPRNEFRQPGVKKPDDELASSPANENGDLPQ